MARSSLVAFTPENEVLNFKQMGGESLKDAWYRFAMLKIDQLVSNPLLFFFAISMWVLLLGIDLCLTLLPEGIS